MNPNRKNPLNSSIDYYIGLFNSRRKKEKEKKTPEFKAKVACPRLHIKVFFFKKKKLFLKKRFFK